MRSFKAAQPDLPKRSASGGRAGWRRPRGQPGPPIRAGNLRHVAVTHAVLAARHRAQAPVLAREYERMAALGARPSRVRIDSPGGV